MIHDFNDNDVPVAAIAHDRVEEPPKGGQVFHVHVLQSMLVLQGPRNPVSLDHLVVEWPQCPRVASSRLRLTGLLAFCRAARTYSIVSRVGLAPGFAYLGRGTLAARAMVATICIHTVYVSFHPGCETSRNC